MRTPEEHYQAGVAMMNLGRWDEGAIICCAREAAPKPITFSRDGGADCLTGEANRRWKI